MQTLLTNAASKLDVMQDALAPLRRQVQIVTDAMDKGMIKCHDPACVRCSVDLSVEPPTVAGAGGGGQGEGAVSDVDVLVQKLEREVARLQSENRR